MTVIVPISAEAFPTFIPRGDPNTTPYIGLNPATTEVYREVFMGIETPAPYEAPAERRNIQTIGQFYKAIEQGIEYLEKEARKEGKTIFHDADGYTQHQNYYFGRGGGRIIPVTDLDSAKLAIQQIVQQGEGAVAPGETLVPTEAWGAYNHYGMRMDGQYGPILGNPPRELSHYFKFKMVADGLMPLPAIYPIANVGNAVAVGNHEVDPCAEALGRAFNHIYSLMLRCLEHSFRAGGEAQRFYFEAVAPFMHSFLPGLANAMMQTPIWKDASASVGPNAVPTWEYVDTGVQEIGRELQQFAEQLSAHQCGSAETRMAARDARLLDTLHHVLGHLERVREGGARLGVALT
ncbi:ferritin-like domain-containing protein [Endothiovibrio diazotrophicus]